MWGLSVAKKKMFLPFTQEGDLLNYVDYSGPPGPAGPKQYYSYAKPRPEIVWRDRDECGFFAELHLESAYKGRSAARAVLRRTDTGTKMEMGLFTFIAMMQKRGLSEPGLVNHGEYSFTKKGQNYMLEPVFSYLEDQRFELANKERAAVRSERLPTS